jgi:hypothetical protein
VTVRDVIQDAFIEARWLAPGEQIGADEAAFGLRKLNDLLDEWTARKLYVYNQSFTLVTLVAGQQIHTIGPTGDFVVASRPTMITSAAFILSGTTQVDLPMTIRDDDWYAAQSVKLLQSAVSTDVYYSPDMPNGSLYFWPICNAARQVRLGLYGVLSSFGATTDPFLLPPGYRKAIKLTLAQELDGPRSSDPALAKAQTLAIKAIFGNNAEPAKIRTMDAGMTPGKGGMRADFNWKTGGPA